MLNPDIENLEKWLDEKLTDSFRPHFDEIPKTKSKGIYFWFMNPEGYDKLSKYVKIKPIDFKYSKEIDGVIFDLVYLGTTGTGKKGNSNLYLRLDWHINQKHRESTINQKQSALSTLRTGLGALLAEDLIEPNTETLINEFMSNNFKIYYLEYPNNKVLIDNDEDVLIKGLRPLLNIKLNSNSYKYSANNSTKFYKKRRNEVENNTKKRLIGHNENMTENNELSKSSKIKTFHPTNEEIQFNFEKEFTNAQEIHYFFSKLKFETGKWQFFIFETKNPKNIICDYWKETEIPQRYFGNTETNKNRKIDNKQVARWKIIEKEMATNNIDSITLKLFKIKIKS